MCTRRQFLSRSTVAMLGLASSAYHLHGDDRESLPDGSASKDMITPEAQRAIDAGLAYLDKYQNASDGSFGSGNGSFPRTSYQGNVAVTSLAALAMMAGGHQPGRGKYGEVVTKALGYVLSQEDNKSGYLLSKRGAGHGPMYGHGFGTLFLAEVHGMVQDEELRKRLAETLRRAVNLIEKCQNGEGSWRYHPYDRIGDVSVTICQIMALRAARNAGIKVQKSVVDKCVEYIKKCRNPDGGFNYQLQARNGSQFARSAAGVVALNCAGIYKGRDVEEGLKYLMRFKPSHGFIPPEVSMHYYYGHYYAAQAMWTAGGHYWSEWYPAIREELLSHPDRDPKEGCWRDRRFSDDYATAMACIILQIPNNYLPILQK